MQDSVLQSRERSEDLQAQESSGNTSNKDWENPFSSSTTAELNIDVHNYNEEDGKFLKKGQSYTVEVKNSKDPGNGKWEITGGHIQGNTKGRLITFIPDADSEIKIKYENPNGEKESRSLKVNN